MFIYKTDAELEAMSAGERDTYAAAKRAHEEAKNQEAIDEAVKTAKENLEKDFDTKLKTANEAATKSISELELVVKTQGEVLAAQKNGSNSNISEKAKEVETSLKAIFDNEQNSQSTKKSFNVDNTIAVNDFTGNDGTTTFAGAIGAIGNYFAQLIPGIFKRPVAKSNVLDYVDVLPLNADRLVTISESRTVSIAVTNECQIKPISKANWAAISEPAEIIATLWKTSTQMRRFYPMFVNSFLNTLQSFFEKEIPKKVLTKILANTTPFTPVPAQATYSNPNNYDAIIAVIAQLIKLGYVPNVVIMSVYAWENLKTLKATDGHYMLANNGSINLLTQSIDFGQVSVKIETDLEIGNDSFIVGDLKSSVKVAIDSQLEYIEWIAENDGERNLKSHRLEKFVASAIPEGTRTGVVSDTFTNVRALITAH